MARHDDMMNVLKQANQINATLAYYLHEQRKEMAKTPAYTSYTTIDLMSPIAMQILNANSRRFEAGIANYGPADIIISDKWFDPTTVLQWFSDPANPNPILPGANQIIPIGYIPSGGNMTLQSSSAAWAYSLGYGAATNQDALLSILDLTFAGVGDINPDSQIDPYHDDGLTADEKPGGKALN